MNTKHRTNMKLGMNSKDGTNTDDRTKTKFGMNMGQLWKRNSVWTRRNYENEILYKYDGTMKTKFAINTEELWKLNSVLGSDIPVV
jgi:hypothetical protein